MAKYRVKGPLKVCSQALSAPLGIARLCSLCKCRFASAAFFKKPPSRYGYTLSMVKCPQPVPKASEDFRNTNTPAYSRLPSQQKTEDVTMDLTHHFLLCLVLSCFMRPVMRWVRVGRVGFGEHRGEEIRKLY